MYLVRPRCMVRDWRTEDAPALSKHADNRKIWANVRDRFPSPYTIEDAEQWVRHCVRALPATDFAIEVDGEVVGGIGVVLYSLTRIYAHVFEFNVASMRVLEKAGFLCEGRLRKAVIKNGQVLDELMYARIREDGYFGDAASR
jgi:ribosomal-protein-alanine N-acetyltransferase